MEVSLSGRNAVICGSTQGIGLAIAREFAEMGANCILLARNEAALHEVVQQLPMRDGQKHLYKVADFSKPEEVKTAITQLAGQLTVHILVNNTGGPAAGPIMQASEDDFLNAFSQHLVCNHILVRAVVDGMKKDGYGRIINIISTSVRIPLRNLGVSNTIRAAVASWAKSLSNEIGEFNITVNNILPGFTDTQRLKSLIDMNAERRSVTTDVIEKEMLAEIPLKRFGQSTETAAVAAFLASPAASYVTGVSIPVDGGRTGTI
jgi:3-oxoacyl-[acyl-carrier protein] reductase